MLTDEGNGPPLFTNGDLNQPALLAFDSNILDDFNDALDSDIITTCYLYNKRWFDQDLRTFNIESILYTNMCKVYRSQSREGDRNKKQGAPPLMSAANKMDPSLIDYSLNDPTIVEEMLIVRVHIQVECFQIRRQQ